MRLSSALGLLLASLTCSAAPTSPEAQNDRCPKLPRDVTAINVGRLLGLEFVCETTAGYGYEVPPGDLRRCHLGGSDSDDTRRMMSSDLLLRRDAHGVDAVAPGPGLEASGGP